MAYLNWVWWMQPTPQRTNPMRPSQLTPPRVTSEQLRRVGILAGDSSGTTQTTSQTVVSPRVGGGTSGDTFWTGGPNLPATKRKKPASILARQLETFRDTEEVESGCLKGFDDE